MSKITDERLAEIEGRLKAATPGPWENDGENIRIRISGDYWRCLPIAKVIGPPESIGIIADVNFITNTPTDINDLLAEIRRQRAELDDIRARLKGWPDSRLDGDGGLVAVTMLELEKLREENERMKKANRIESEKENCREWEDVSTCEDCGTLALGDCPFEEGDDDD